MLTRKILLTFVIAFMSTQVWASCTFSCTKKLAEGVDVTKLGELTEEVKKCFTKCPLKDTKNFTCVVLSRKIDNANDVAGLLELLHQGPGEDLAYGIEAAQNKLEAIALAYKSGDVKEFQYECGMHLNATASGKEWVKGGSSSNFDHNLDRIRVKVKEIFDGGDKAPSFKWTAENEEESKKVSAGYSLDHPKEKVDYYNEMRFKMDSIRTKRRKS